MRGGHKEGYAEGCFCSPTAQASGLDRHTDARDQHNMVCHESINKAFSYRPYPDNLLIILGSLSSHPYRMRSRVAGSIRHRLDIVIHAIGCNHSNNNNNNKSVSRSFRC
jgi:hypothetical protein